MSRLSGHDDKDSRRSAPLRVGRARWYREQWLRAASGTGWTTSRRLGDYIELRRDHEVRLVNGPDVGIDLNINFRLAGSSSLSAKAFAMFDVPIPATVEYSLVKASEILADIGRRPGAVVLKPAANTGGGRGVTVGPTTRMLGLGAIADIARLTRKLVVQDHVPGDVLRILVLDGQVLDVVARSPASVIGDGERSVRSLIIAENNRRLELGALATGFIPLRTDCRAALAHEGLSLSSTPAAGEVVRVAGCSNTGSELESIRVKVLDSVASMAALAATAVGVRLAGVDLIVDESGEPVCVLEVNGAPGLHWHMLVTGEPFDPFEAMLI